MQIHEPIIINKRSFSLKELQYHAAEARDDTSRPGWERELFQFVHDFLHEERPLIQKTSGTTGDPKRIPLERHAMLQSARMTLEHFALTPGMKALLCLPVNYIAGKMMVVRSLTGGLELVAKEPAGNPLENLDTKIDFAAMVPMQVYEIFKSKSKMDLPDTLIIGGGKISPSLRDDIRLLESTRIFETFAMSETYSHFAVRKLNGNPPDRFFKTLPGVQIDKDPRGCLVVFVPGLTAAPVVTNDLIEIKEEKLFRWLGRIDNRISSGGIKIIPELLEERIKEKVPFELVVLGLPDEKLGQKLVLAIEAEDKDQLPTDLPEWMDQHLQKHEIPKSIQVLSTFPRNSSQKILRQEIANMIS